MGPTEDARESQKSKPPAGLSHKIGQVVGEAGQGREVIGPPDTVHAQPIEIGGITGAPDAQGLALHLAATDGSVVLIAGAPHETVDEIELLLKSFGISLLVALPNYLSKERTPSPILSEHDRDQRTVFVIQLAARLTTSELRDFFSKVGRVRDARIVSDRNSRRSKG